MKVIGHKLRAIFGICIGINALYFFGGFVCFPAYVRKMVIRELTRTGTNDAEIEGVRFNPFAFEIVFTNFRFRNRTNGLLFSAKTLSLGLSPVSSLRSGMPVFTDFLLLDAKLTYVKHTTHSRLFELIRSFDWSAIPPFRLDRARILDAAVLYDDMSMPERFSLHIATLDIEIKNFVLHGDAVNSLAFDAVTEDGGEINIVACFDLEPYGISGEAVFADLRPGNYESYVDRLLGEYTVVDGLLSGRTLFDLDSSPTEGRALLSDLSFTVDSLCVRKRGEYRESFGFGLLSLEDAEVDFSGKTIAFDSVRMADGSLVLDSFLPGAQAGAGRFRGAAKWESLSLEESSLRFGSRDYSFGKSAVRNGSLVLSDERGDAPVKVSLDGIDVSLGPVYSDVSRLSEFSVRANTGDQGSAQLFGETNPFDMARLARFRLLAQNVSLVPFSPYAEGYLGYGLIDGIFKLDTEFLLREKRLTVRNNFILDRLELGRKSESSLFAGGTMPAIPMPAVVALLEDSRGSIELDVPIGGTLSDPEYDIGKAATDAVFRTFGFFSRWLSGVEENRYYVDFPAGSSSIVGQDTAMLDEVVRLLAESPGSVIDIEGSVDASEDTGDLCLLADGRAAAARDYIVLTGPVAEERVFVLDSPDGTAFVEGSRAYMRLNDPLRE